MAAKRILNPPSPTRGQWAIDGTSPEVTRWKVPKLAGRPRIFPDPTMLYHPITFDGSQSLTFPGDVVPPGHFTIFLYGDFGGLRAWGSVETRGQRLVLYQYGGPGTPYLSVSVGSESLGVYHFGSVAEPILEVQHLIARLDPLVLRQEGTNLRVFLHGQLLGEDTRPGPAVRCPRTIGGINDRRSDGAQGSLWEILIYSRALADAERAEVETYLREKFHPTPGSSAESSSSSEESSSSSPSSAEPSSDWSSEPSSSSPESSSSSSEEVSSWYYPSWSDPSSSESSSSDSSSSDSPSSESSSEESSSSSLVEEEASDPVPVTAGLHLWLRSDRHVEHEEGRIISWGDARGTPLAARQDDPLLRPQWWYQPIAGQDAVSFDGHSLQLPLNQPLPAGTFTLFVAGRANSERPSDGSIFDAGSLLWSGAVGESCISLSVANNSSSLYETPSGNLPVISGGPAITLGPLTLVYTPEVRVWEVNGQILGHTPGAPAADLALGHQIGGMEGQNLGFAGAIYEILLYNYALDASERLLVDTYLQTRYGGLPSSSSLSSEESSSAVDLGSSSELSSLSSDSSGPTNEVPSSSNEGLSSDSSEMSSLQSSEESSSESAEDEEPSSPSQQDYIYLSAFVEVLDFGTPGSLSGLANVAISGYANATNLTFSWNSAAASVDGVGNGESVGVTESTYYAIIRFDMSFMEGLSLTFGNLFVASEYYGGTSVTYAVSAKIKPSEDVRGVVGDIVPSIHGSQGEKHFVTPKRISESPHSNLTHIILKAEVFPVNSLADVFSWQGDGEPDPNDPMKWRVSRSQAGKFVVKIVAKNGTTADLINVWVVNAKGSILQVPLKTLSHTSVTMTYSGIERPLSALYAGPNPSGEYVFKFVIEPYSIIDEDGDIPDLRGNSDTAAPVPAGEHVLLGRYFENGANTKWDVSRQIEIEIHNPQLIRFGDLPDSQGRTFLLQPIAFDIAEPFPHNDVMGNDDANTTDSANNPYEVLTLAAAMNRNYAHPKGELRSIDRPKTVMTYAGQENGVVWEQLDRFREFVRLQIGTRWYRISDWLNWHTYLKLEVREKRWTDNGSSTGSGH